MNRVSAIKKITSENPKAIFLISNGLSSREANFFLNNNQTFYMLHAMGETLSVGLGMAIANKKIKIVVIDGDYNALMGAASWHNVQHYKNIKYYILKNKISETTGSQKIPSLEIPQKLKKFINIINIKGKKLNSPNPKNPNIIKNNLRNFLKKRKII